MSVRDVLTELTQSATPANRGNKPVGVPDIQANLWAEWDTPWLEVFTLTGGAIYTDSQYVNQANTQKLDSWPPFDLRRITRANVDARP